MNTYDPPTYRRYNKPTEQWQEWKRQAHAIGFDEAYRHSTVATHNDHRCRDCFCCACAEYVAEQRAERTDYANLKVSLLDLGRTSYENIRAGLIEKRGYDGFRELQNEVFKEIGTIEFEKKQQIDRSDKR